MTDNEMTDDQIEEHWLENRQERDEEAHRILQIMSDYLTRHSVDFDFPLPWKVANVRQEEENHRVFLSLFSDDLESENDK